MLKEIKNKVVKGSRDRHTLMDVVWDDGFEASPVVLFCHGYKGFKDWGLWNTLARDFAQQGIIFVKFNFSYNGGTLEQAMDCPDPEAFAANNFSTELDDLLRMINEVDSDSFRKEFPADTSRLFLIGHSRGGGIALLAAAEDNRVKKLVTWAALADLGLRFTDEKAMSEWKEKGRIHVLNTRTGQLLPHDYQFFEDFASNRDRLNVLAAAGRISIPWLIAHGEVDESVPVEHAIQLSAANPFAELLLLEEADHTFGCSHPFENQRLPSAMAELSSRTISFLFGES